MFFSQFIYKHPKRDSADHFLNSYPSLKFYSRLTKFDRR